MAIVRRTPSQGLSPWDSGQGLFSGFDSLRREMDRIFDRFTTGGGLGEPGAALSTYVPPVDIIEEDDQYIVKAEVPGVHKEDVKITVTNDLLTIRGEKQYEKELNEKHFYRMERAAGTFQRTFNLPASVQPDQVEATFNDGILTVVLPKAEEARSKQIDVKVK